MKVELNPEINKTAQSAAVADVAPVDAEKTAVSNDPAGLSKDMWDKRNLMSSLKDAWDSDDTVVISDGAKRGFGIVGDPRIVGEESKD